MGNIGLGQLLIIVVIVIVIFGTKKLRHLGADLGASLKDFKKEMQGEENNKQDNTAADADFSAQTLNDESAEKTTEKQNQKTQV